LLELAARQDEADIIHLAYLTDRVRIAEGKTQFYGTQGKTNPNGTIGPFPIEDEEQADERCKAIELEPVVKYFKSMNERCKTNSM
jgi:hypothetical protein